jgi:hypothetical protein
MIRRAGFPSRASKSIPAWDLPITTTGRDNPLTRAHGTASPFCHPLGDSFSRSPDQPEKPLRRVSHRLRRQRAHALDNLSLGRSVQVLQEELVRDNVFQAQHAPSANQEVQRGRRHQRGKERHDHERNEHPFANEPVLESQQTQNHFHGAARVHGQADSPRRATVHCAQSRASAGPDQFSEAGDHDDYRRDAQVEVGHEIGAFCRSSPAILAVPRRVARARNIVMMSWGLWSMGISRLAAVASPLASGGGLSGAEWATTVSQEPVFSAGLIGLGAPGLRPTRNQLAPMLQNK